MLVLRNLTDHCVDVRIHRIVKSYKNKLRNILSRQIARSMRGHRDNFCRQAQTYAEKSHGNKLRHRFYNFVKS